MVALVKPTLRQELFVRELLKTGIQAVAWRRVYHTAKNAKVMASKTLAKPHVLKRYNELRERQMQKSDITIDKVLSDLQWSIDTGKAQGKPSEVIAGANAQAKLVGLLRERVETGHVGEFGEGHSIADVLEIVAKEAGPEAAMTLAAMFGLEAPKSQTTKRMEEAILFIAESPSDAVN